MARKRSVEFDYICRKCLCPCNPPWQDPKHQGGGPGMRACKGPAVPVLRTEYETEMDELARAAVDVIRDRQRPKSSSVDGGTK